MSGIQGTAIIDKLAEYLRRGELLDLAPNLAFGSPGEDGIMKSWDGAHSIKADDLRDLLCGRVVTDPDPRGLRLRGAHVRGRLDLDNLNTTVKLTLLDCFLDEGITAAAAHLPGLSLRRCLLTNASEPALYADELRTDAGLSLEGCTIRACTSDGAMRMNGAQIGGQLDCSGATITNPSGPVLHGERLKVNDNVLLCAGFTADGAGKLGAVRLTGAQIGGQLDCSGIIANSSGSALDGEHLHVEGNVLLRAKFTAHDDGAVRLIWARVRGQLDCSGAIITNASGPGLLAGALQVTGSVFLSDGFTADCASELGAVRLVGAHIGGRLDCAGAIITNRFGPVLCGERLRIDGDVLLRAGFTANGAGEQGTIQLTGAKIGGELDCSGATIRNDSGPALRADSLRVTSRVFLRAGFAAHGTGEWGAVRLGGAGIGSRLDCSGATICNPSGPALIASDLHTGGNVLLRAGFTADGDTEQCVIRLIGANIGGQLDCSGAVVKNRSGPQHRWTLDGLTYQRLPLDPLGKGAGGWLDLFRTATPAYAPQPYQQLASIYRAAGHDGDVRRILIAQRQAQLDRGVLTRRERLWARITGITLGYGYQPWRALLFMLAVVVSSVALAVILGAHGALVHPLDAKNPAATTTPCTVTERVEVGLSVGAPFFDTHVRDRCTTTNTATGIGLDYSTWGLQLLTGAFAALFIAGFTGIVRKT